MLKYLTFANFFKLAFAAAFLGGLAYGGWELYMYFNVESLVYDVRSRDAGTAKRSYDELLALPAARTVPPILNALPKEGEEAVAGMTNFERLYELLAEITGEPYHEDAAEWRRWAEGPEGQRFLGKKQ